MQVNFPNLHDISENSIESQVLIAITGSPAAIKERLTRILEEVQTFGKPMQGSTLQYDCYSTIITPMWNTNKD